MMPSNDFNNLRRMNTCDQKSPVIFLSLKTSDPMFYLFFTNVVNPLFHKKTESQSGDR